MAHFVSSACCLPASAEATVRARPAARFAPLNHMLIHGFFFNQGLAIRFPFCVPRGSIDEAKSQKILQRTINARPYGSFQREQTPVLGRPNRWAPPPRSRPEAHVCYRHGL